MDLPMFTVDSFSKSPFGGNPAAVCVVQYDKTLSDSTMQKIAREMNLSETAFVKELTVDSLSTGEQFGLRWFTPTNEVKLCGHATLASAAVILRQYKNSSSLLKFDTLSGTLTAESRDNLIVLDLPLAGLTDQVPGAATSVIEKMSAKLAACVSDLKVMFSPSAQKLLVRLPHSWTRADLESLPVPDAKVLLAMHDGSKFKGVILTTDSPSVDDTDVSYDFISRYFAPWNGIPEDPVTGSAHTVLGKYWSQQLGKSQLYARQCSSRGGDLTLNVESSRNRILVSGAACIVLSGVLSIPA